MSIKLSCWLVSLAVVLSSMNPSPVSSATIPTDSSSTQISSEEYNYQEYSSSSSSEEELLQDDQLQEDDHCLPTHFYHIRGHHCVPFKCPKGNSLRDFHTGECLFNADGTPKETTYTGYKVRKVHYPAVLSPKYNPSWRSVVTKRVKVRIEENNEQVY